MITLTSNAIEPHGTEEALELKKHFMRILRSCLPFLIATFIAACTTLTPFEGTEETTPPAVTRGIWSEIETIRSGDWQVPLNEGRGALGWRLRAIDSATSSIDLQSFIWSFDDVGSVIQERLLAAADRGVNVRILIDDSFLVGEDQHLLQLHRHENVQYRVYNPYERRPDSAMTRFVLNLGDFDRLDHRMHNKSMVVDNQVAIVGGRNLADEYFGFDDAANFRDMELLVGGPIVEKISGSFDTYWNDRWSFPVDKIGSVRAAHVPREKVQGEAAELDRMYPRERQESRNAAWRDIVRQSHRGRSKLIADRPPEDRPEALKDRPVQVADALSRLITSARDEVTIVSAYLIPTPGLVEALKSAVSRGVRVRLLTNSINSNNHISAYAAYRGHIAELLSFGAEVHEMRTLADIRPRYILPPVLKKHLGLHAKYMIVDKRHVVVGSANLDPRSLRINTELVLIVDSRSLANELLKLTDPDFDENNAWRLALKDDGKIVWMGNGMVLDAEPALRGFQRIEEWFFAHLPIEDEL